MYSFTWHILVVVKDEENCVVSFFHFLTIVYICMYICKLYISMFKIHIWEDKLRYTSFLYNFTNCHSVRMDFPLCRKDNLIFSGRFPAVGKIVANVEDSFPFFGFFTGSRTFSKYHGWLGKIFHTAAVKRNKKSDGQKTRGLGKR